MSDSFPAVEYQRLRVKSVRDVIVTDIVTTGATSTRAIRILGANGLEDDPQEVLEIIIESDGDAADIELTTPAINY